MCFNVFLYVKTHVSYIFHKKYSVSLPGAHHMKKMGKNPAAIQLKIIDGHYFVFDSIYNNKKKLKNHLIII
jgi:hypothetical protein